MNLQAAVQELGSRSPRATPAAIVLETVVVVGFSFLLVSLFA